MGNVLKALLSMTAKVSVTLLVWFLLPYFGIDLHWGVLAGVLAVLSAAAVFTYRAINFAPGREPSGGRESLIGATATALTCLEPDGVVRLSGENWSARSPNGRVKAGDDVVIVSCRGLRLTVRPAAPQGIQSGALFRAGLPLTGHEQAAYHVDGLP